LDELWWGEDEQALAGCKKAGDRRVWGMRTKRRRVGGVGWWRRKARSPRWGSVI